MQRLQVIREASIVKRKIVLENEKGDNITKIEANGSIAPTKTPGEVMIDREEEEIVTLLMIGRNEAGEMTATDGTIAMAGIGGMGTEKTIGCGALVVRVPVGATMIVGDVRDTSRIHEAVCLLRRQCL